MFVVVAVYFGVAFKANRDRILDPVVMAIRALFDVIRFDLHTAEAMANAAAPVALPQQLGYLLSWERHAVFLRKSSSLRIVAY